MTDCPPPDCAPIAPRTVRFAAADGWILEGDVYSGPNPRLGILVSAGTGFPHRVYRHLAAHLAARGAVVLCFDYRGIGGSRGSDAAFLTVDLPDWGKLDMPAAVDALAQAAPGLPLTHVAHSVGGHLVGLMPNHERLVRHGFLAVGTGYFGAHQLRNWPLEMYFWWGMGSWSLMRHGYIKPEGGWQGEPLPPRVFRTWRRWSQRRAYFRPDLEGPLAPQYFARVAAPIRSWIFSDDPIATRKSGCDLLGCYPNAPQDMALRSPASLGQKRIGHDGAFRPGREALWNELWDWLAESPSARAA